MYLAPLWEDATAAINDMTAPKYSTIRMPYMKGDEIRLEKNVGAVIAFCSGTVRRLKLLCGISAFTGLYPKSAANRADDGAIFDILSARLFDTLWETSPL